jgi:hypothetical protein
MFERYIESARRAIFFARYEASMAASPTIDPEHLLLGILKENAGLLIKLTNVAEPAAVLRQKVERNGDTSNRLSTSVEMPLAMATKAVLTRAHQESEALGHRHIGPEHLLLGLLLSDPGSLAAQALSEIGITRESICKLAPAITPNEATVADLDHRDLLQQLIDSLFGCLKETFLEVRGLYLDPGTSLFETLAEVSAAEASQPIAENCATVAAQVEHVRFYLEVLGDVIRNKEMVKVDWQEIWQTVHQVTPAEWEDQQRRLRETYHRTMITLKTIDRWDGKYEIGSALCILAHTAYHLGGIRQALGAIRSSPAQPPISQTGESQK